MMQERTMRRILVLLLGTLAVLDVLAIAVRVVYLLHYESVPRFSAEGEVLYSIWKLRHGYPLYESPFQPFFSVTLYNFLSYETYAAVFRLWGVSDASSPAASRFVSAFFAAAGAVFQYLAARELSGPAGNRRLILLLTIVTWTGWVLPGWWPFAIKPDIGAVTLDLAGIWLVLQVLHGRNRTRLAGAALLFLAAWSFKQSHVIAAGATTAYLLIGRRSWREAALVAVPFAAGVALALAIGGPLYRLNIITAPSLSPLAAIDAWHGIRTILLPEALFWAVTAIAGVAVAADPRAMAERSLRLFGADLVYPLILVLATGAAAVLMLAKEGSAVNHAIQLKVCASLVAAGVLGGTLRSRRMQAIIVAAAAVMLASHVTRFSAERATFEPSLRGSDPSVASRKATVALIASLPRPVYAQDELYAMPWIASGNTYPAIVIDHVVYDVARDRGMLSDTLEAMIGRRFFASLAIADTSPLVPIARRAGYELVETVPQIHERPVAIFRRP